jgi:hypothetical protein
MIKLLNILSEWKVRSSGFWILTIMDDDKENSKILGIYLYLSKEDAERGAVAYNYILSKENGSTDLSRENYIQTYSLGDILWNGEQYMGYYYQIEQAQFGETL